MSLCSFLKTTTKNTILILSFLLAAYIARSQTTQTFKWVSWEKVSQQTKAELKKIIHHFGDGKPTTVYDEIVAAIKNDNCNISVTFLDINGDGKPEYGVGFSCSAYCGTGGCSYEFYSERGKKQCSLGSHTGKFIPSKNGIIFFETRRLAKLETVKWWPQYEAFANEKNNSAATPTSSFAIIKGTLHDPGDAGLEGDEVVVAKNIETGKEEKTKKGDLVYKKDLSAATFTLKVPPGNYYIYSNVPRSWYVPPTYYTEFDPSGVKSKSHKKIVVEAIAGKTISKIDPQDRYYTDPKQLEGDLDDWNDLILYDLYESVTSEQEIEEILDNHAVEIEYTDIPYSIIFILSKGRIGKKAMVRVTGSVISKLINRQIKKTSLSKSEIDAIVKKAPEKISNTQLKELFETSAINGIKKGATLGRIQAGSLSEFKNLVNQLSKPGSELTVQELRQFEKLTKQFGGTLRYDLTPLKGKILKPHVQVEGLGSSVQSRHIWLGKGVK